MPICLSYIILEGISAHYDIDILFQQNNFKSVCVMTIACYNTLYCPARAIMREYMSHICYIGVYTTFTLVLEDTPEAV